MPLHRLLARQVRRTFGAAEGEAVQRKLAGRELGDSALAGLQGLLELVSESYAQYEDSLAFASRNLDLSSQELMAANQLLRQEAEARGETLEALRRATNLLLRPLGREVADSEDIQALTRHLGELVEDLASTRKELENRQRVLDEHAIVSITDLAGDITYVNDKFCRISGYSPAELLGRNHRILKSGIHPASVYEDMWRTIAEGRVWQGEVCNRRKDGSFYWVEATIAPSLDARGQPYQYISIRTDISLLKRAQRDQELARSDAEAKLAVAKALSGQEPLQRRLDLALQAIFGMRGLQLQRKGGLFSLKEGDGCLRMATCQGDFSAEFLRDEAEVPLGRCLCGRAAASLEVLVSDDCFSDHRHENRWPDMTAHGHYVVPLVDSFGGSPRCMGVLFLYTDPQPHAGAERLETLREIGDLLAYALAREDAMVQLVAAREGAERASRTKSEFLASMSHELRTPLNAILGYSQLLRLDGGGERDLETIQEAGGEIERAGAHLLSLINDILDLARIEAGRLEVALAPVGVAELFAGCESVAGVLGQNLGIAVGFAAGPCAGAFVLADPIRLKQVLLNLISNGVKYNRPCGRVHIGCAPAQEGWLRISVQDTGPGLSKAQQERLFLPFERLGAEQGSIEGTGIGLTITRHLVQLMGCHIGLASEVGTGSTFWIEVPLVRAPEPAAAARPAEPAAVHLDGGRRYRVLYIEDNPVNLGLMRRVIRRRPDLDLADATSAETGLPLAREVRPDLVLLDINMPGMNGYQVLAELRRMPELGAPPVIALTANAMKGDLERGLEAGFSAYVTKPIDIPAFYALLDELLARRP